ncbi:MAG: acetoin dehydrogenase dihydrolipoyllysine-residue acetyltransferase subunit [Robiginitomaculum sp.]|nr:acetoin dehydrogenase dihydrolipoyllysine-residue acetyltransferase subunit [Robiginitomaculum sp.]
MDMEGGKVGEWLVSLGERVIPGGEIVEIESDKVTNVLDVTAGGILRRQLVKSGETHPVGTLLGVIAEDNVSEDSISNFIAGYASSDTDVLNITEPNSEVVDELIEVDGQFLHYTSVGEGAASVLLIHGFGGNLSSWGGAPLALSTDYRVISVELPGHGTSSKQVMHGGSKDFADLFFAFLDRLGVGEISLVGHSLGGSIAAQMARLEPSRIKSLSLLSNYGLGTKVDTSYIDDFVAASRRKEVKLCLKRLFSDVSVVKTDMIESVLRLKRLDGVDEALRVIAGKIQEEQPDEEHIDISLVPTQIIIGKEDDIICFDENLLSGVENVSLIEGAAHMPQMEKNPEVMDLINGFLKQFWANEIRQV